MIFSWLINKAQKVLCTIFARKKKTVEEPKTEVQETPAVLTEPTSAEKVEIDNVHFRLKKHINQKLISREYIFFNIMLHKFNWVLDWKCPDGALAYVKFKNKDINELDDGSIFINARILQDPEFTWQNYFMILIHEFMHITFMHNVRQQDRDSMVWNLAADHVINSMIKRTFRSSDVAPYKGWETVVLFENEPQINRSDITTEEVYNYLIDNNINNCRFSLVSIERNGNGLQTWTVKDNKTGKEYKIDVSENKSKEFENFNKVAGEIFNQIKDRGDMPGNLMEVFNKFYKTEIPWTELLKDAIHKCLTPLPNSRGWRTLNKHFMPLGYTLPGITYDYEENADSAVVSIDTSGSVSSKELNEFACILVESISYFKSVVLITHDHQIHQVEEFHKFEGEKLKQFISKTGFKGRGGTSHLDVFNKIQELDNQLNEGFSMYLSLTDGYSDIDENWSKNEWSRKGTIPTYFIITRSGSIPRVCKDNAKAIKINNTD